MSNVHAFLERHGMAPEQVDPAALSRAIEADMRRALAGESASTLMLPSHLYGEGKPAMDTPVVVIDAGGTNFRAALVTFTADGPVIQGLTQSPMPGTHGEVDWSDFIRHCADGVEPFLAQSRLIGICFSYSADPQPDGDSLVLNLNKEIRVRNSAGRPVGGDLKAELQRRGHEGVETVLLNDTLAVQFGAAAGHHLSPNECIGMVCGTGANICCALPVKDIPKLSRPGDDRAMLVNCESGFFLGVPQGDYDKELEAQSADPGRYLHEKMVSGAYMGTLCRLTLRGAAREGVFSAAGNALLAGLEELTSQEADTLSGPLTALSPDDLALADEIIAAVFERSGRAMCAALSAVLRIADRGDGSLTHIGAEGSLFQKSRRFRPALDRAMESYAAGECGLRFDFLTCQNTTLIGTACAALLMQAARQG